MVVPHPPLTLDISVSVLALEEFNTLQQKYELETHCRFEAEKYAAEVTALRKIENKVFRPITLKRENVGRCQSINGHTFGIFS